MRECIELEQPISAAIGYWFLSAFGAFFFISMFVIDLENKYRSLDDVCSGSSTMQKNMQIPCE